MAFIIVTAGILLNPFSADAEELHWGFKKATGRVPPDAGGPFDSVT